MLKNFKLKKYTQKQRHFFTYFNNFHLILNWIITYWNEINIGYFYRLNANVLNFMFLFLVGLTYFTTIFYS